MSSEIVALRKLLGKSSFQHSVYDTWRFLKVSGHINNPMLKEWCLSSFVPSLVFNFVMFISFQSAIFERNYACNMSYVCLMTHKCKYVTFYPCDESMFINT